MSHMNLSIPSLKKLMKPLDMGHMALCKTPATHPPSFSVPDRLSHLLNFRLTFHGTTGQAKHLQTFTKLKEVDMLVQVTYLSQGECNIPSEINR